ncbi:MAG: chorismate-binding protein [Acidimicrobiia bacterium]|nr:chorismate-binding protein [Acidimicrobiia bacterium]
MEIPCVRFDDLSPGGSGSFGLLEPVVEITARRLEDVVPAMAAAEQAAREGRWVAGYVSYEAAPAFNPVLSVRPPGLYDPMREIPLVRFQAFDKRIELEEINSVHFPAGDYSVSGWTADATPDEYRDDLAAIGRAIMAGEVARLTHTFRLHAAFSGDPAALYRDLILSQRGPHAAYIDVGRFRLVSASPAGFFRRSGDVITMRPVLASIRRGRWLEEDLHLAELLRYEGEESYTNRLVTKEIEAELAELGELIPRSDGDRYVVERYETLWHLTTEIRARLLRDIGLAEIFGAVFPPVSVTGVPRVEAMNLVTATEDSPRGIYCGAIGFLRPTAAGVFDASFNVAVRTVVVDQEEGVAEFGVGTAITTSSEVVTAYEEARLKAKVLVDRRPEFMLVEELRCAAGTAPHVEEKLDRLLASAEYFGYDVGRSVVEATVAEAVTANHDPSVLTLLVDRDGEVRIEVTKAPLWQEGPGGLDLLAGALAQQQVSTENVYLFHNTTNQRFADALMRQHPDVDTVIHCNERDEVAGAVGGNVVADIGGTWATPPIECGTVATAHRNQLIAAGTIVEQVILRDQLLAATDVAVLDDVHGWRTVGLVG